MNTFENKFLTFDKIDIDLDPFYSVLNRILKIQISKNGEKNPSYRIDLIWHFVYAVAILRVVDTHLWHFMDEHISKSMAKKTPAIV